MNFYKLKKLTAENLTRYYSVYLTIYLLTILFFSVIPTFNDGMNSGIGAHGPVYFALSIGVIYFLKLKERDNYLFMGALLAGTYGLCMEFIQYFIPYRHFEIEDIIFNYIFTFTVIIPVHLFEKLRSSSA